MSDNAPSSHPLIAHKLARMREDELPLGEYKRLMREIAMLLAYEVTSDFEVDVYDSRNSRGEVRGFTLRGEQPVIVPVLRSGLIMAEGIQDIMPRSLTGHIGLHKDKTTATLTEYFISLPNAENRTFILTDPVVATGDTACRAINVLKENGVRNHQIRFVSIAVSLAGLDSLMKAHPEIRLHYAALDDISDKRELKSGLNNNLDVVPGIGSVSDRLFGFRTR